jgi:hypothetical protein
LFNSLSTRSRHMHVFQLCAVTAVCVLVALLACGCQRYYAGRISPESVPSSHGRLNFEVFPGGRPDVNVSKDSADGTLWYIKLAPISCDSLPTFQVDSARVHLLSTKSNRSIFPVAGIPRIKGPGCLEGVATFYLADSVLGDYRIMGTMYIRFAKDDSTIAVPIDAAAKFKRGWELINK